MRPLLLGTGPSAPRGLDMYMTLTEGDERQFAAVNYYFRIPQLENVELDTWFSAAHDQRLFDEFFLHSSASEKVPRRIVTAAQYAMLESIYQFSDVAIVNLWAALGSAGAGAERYLRGSHLTSHLPTTGLQALHFLLEEGETEIMIAGFDFYFGSRPYAYSSSRRSGYEDTAHSLAADFDYLLVLLRSYRSVITVLDSLNTETWQMLSEISRLGQLEGEIRVLGSDR